MRMSVRKLALFEKRLQSTRSFLTFFLNTNTWSVQTGIVSAELLLALPYCYTSQRKLSMCSENLLHLMTQT